MKHTNYTFSYIILLLTLGLAPSSRSYGQNQLGNIKPHDVVAAAGNQLYLDSNNAFVTFTIGEPIVETMIFPNNIASQGFQQPFLDKIPCNIFMANAFTPIQNDGKNDIFGPVHLCELEISRFSVYDRWGALIYESFNEHPNWDGSFNGTPCKSGLYPWVLYYKAKKGTKTLTMRGAVSLIN